MTDSQSSISIAFVYKRLNVKTVLFQTIQFSKCSGSSLSLAVHAFASRVLMSFTVEETLLTR